ncbi:MAG: type II toxin-antitoxin system Phd/YefM family antitoxin [Micrococcales bacterium]
MTLADLTKSDNLIFMKKVTATEASRNFSEILDLVDSGEEIVIIRGKKEIAKITPIAEDWEERRQKILNIYASKTYYPDSPVWDIIEKMRDEEHPNDHRYFDWNQMKWSNEE